jgi:hypothetical protein
MRKILIISLINILLVLTLVSISVAQDNNEYDDPGDYGNIGYEDLLEFAAGFGLEDAINQLYQDGNLESILDNLENRIGEIISLAFSFMKSEITSQMSFIGSYASYGLQSGQNAPFNTMFFSSGVTINIAFIKLPQLIIDAINSVVPTVPDEVSVLLDNPALPMGLLYVGMNFPVIPVSAYIRGLYFPQSVVSNIGFDEDFILLGIGGGANFEIPIPVVNILTIKAIANYHFMSGVKMIDMHSYGINGIVSLNFPVAKWFIRPYIGLGWSNTTVVMNFDLTKIFPIADFLDEFTLGAQDINLPDDMPAELKQKVEDNLDEIILGMKNRILEESQNFNLLFTNVNIPFSIGTEFSIIAIKIDIAYSGTINLSIIGTPGATFLDIMPPGNISISFGIGL